MAKKKKKKAALRVSPTGPLGQMQQVQEFHKQQIDGVIGTLVNANSKIMDLEHNVDALMQQMRSIREAAQKEAELRVQAESMVMRKLIHTLLADRKGVDMFLDRLSDLAPDIAKGVLVGTFEDVDLVSGVRPNRKDDSPTPI